MNNIILAEKAKDAANNYKTLYVAGCFGAPLNAKNKQRYTTNHAYNAQADRRELINNASDDTFGFDCVCFIKGLLWGWCGDKDDIYGGAEYCVNGMPDIGTEELINDCIDVSDDFTNIEVGEVVWLMGHVGIYVGDGLVAECTPSWQNKVQLTALANIGGKDGYPARKWDRHGKLSCIEYIETPTMTDSLKQLDDAVVKVANEVIQGLYGDGEARKEALGEYYRVVQDKVNAILGA